MPASVLCKDAAVHILLSLLSRTAAHTTVLMSTHVTLNYLLTDLQFTLQSRFTSGQGLSYVKPTGLFKVTVEQGIAAEYLANL